MGCLLIPALLALLVLADAAIVRMLQQRQARAGWWAGLSAAWLAGAVLGAWGGFFFEYQLSPRLRVLGAPVPTAFFHREGPPGEEQWVDFLTPAPLLFAASNVALLGLLAFIGRALLATRGVTPQRSVATSAGAGAQGAILTGARRGPKGQLMFRPRWS
jgi:hypothetical protein